MNSLVDRRLHPRLGVLATAAAALGAAVAAIALLVPGHGFGSPSSAQPTLAPASVASATGSSGSGHLSGALARLASSDPRRQVQVIIQLARGIDPGRGRDLVRSLGGRPGLDLHIIRGFSAELSAAAAGRLAASPLVHAVSLNAKLKESSFVTVNPEDLATTFDQSVGASRLWRVTTGKGIGVAVIDTGIAGDLSDFRTSQEDPTSRVVSSVVVDPSATSAGDTYGHGTAVAGLIAGNGGDRDASDPLRGQYAGTAPDANLVSIKIGDDSGQATTLDAIYGLQFAVDHRDDYNIRVVNMSFRSTSAESATTDPLDAAAEQAWFAGITVVAAAGNLGSAQDAVSYAPGNDPYVITVGAVDEQGTRFTADDTQTSWSSQGTTQDGITKPDVLAPGAHIISTLAPNSSFATLCPSCVISGAYFQVSGTSLAAPIVSGIAADLLAAHPDWTPDQVKGAIVNSATALANGGREVRGSAAYWASGDQLVANQNLTPNTLLDPSTHSIDMSRASWSAGNWTPAVDGQRASWSRASWSRASWSCNSCGTTSAGDVTPTRASWSGLGWSTMWG